MGFLLFIIALLLVMIFFPIGVLFTIVKSFILLDFSFISDYFRRLAISLDQFGNVSLGGLLNTLFIDGWSIHKFGDPDETISSVLGKNKKAETLKYLGKKLDCLLDKLDKNHSLNSIER